MGKGLGSKGIGRGLSVWVSGFGVSVLLATT